MRVVIRGAGDIASGIALRLYRAGMQVIMTDLPQPTAIRRTVCFSQAVILGSCTVEDVTAVRADTPEAAAGVLAAGRIPVLADPECRCRVPLRPDALVDAILAKKNLGTNRQMAPKTIALGPGFEAGKDVDLVIETNRGHNLGRIIGSGSAQPDTGIPGVIAGYGKERVIHSPAMGIFRARTQIGDRVEKDQPIGVVVTGQGEVEIPATLTGILRGLIRNGYPVTKGFKIADIDPRESEYENCFTISDKARCIAGSVLEALLYLEAKEASL